MPKNYMQLSNICNYQYFIFRLFDCLVGTSELHFCSPHWIQKYLNPKNLSACAKPPYLILPPCILSPYSIPPHACPPPILSHPMHTLPLFYPTPYSIHPPILSQPMHALPPLFYPTPCMPSPPILSQPMHTFPLFYPIPCIPSPCSIPAHAHPPPILSQPIHSFPLFYSTPYMPFPYSVQLYACPLLFSTSPHMPPQYSVPAYACPCNSLSHEPGRHVSPLTSENATFECSHWVYHHYLPSLVIWGINLWHLIVCFHSHELTTLTHLHIRSTVNLHIYHIITTNIVYHYSSVDITHSSTWLHIHNNKLHTPIIGFFIKCSHYSTGKVDGYKCDLSRNYVIHGKS